jgi:tungstate transport system permease protein
MHPMSDIPASLALALRLVAGFDPGLWSIVLLSLEVSLAAAVIACALGLPLGGLVAACRFPGRRAAIVVLNALLGLPSVVVGLLVYLLLSRAGPLGELGILFTPTAIVLAQSMLVLPVVAALSRQFVEDAWHEYREQLTSLGVSAPRAVPTLLWDLRYSLLTVAMLGFGRAASEVGAVMIVGGNIDGVTRVMTTAIALETSKGDLPLALGLGFVLVAVVLALNALAYAVREWSMRRHG